MTVGRHCNGEHAEQLLLDKHRHEIDANAFQMIPKCPLSCQAVLATCTAPPLQACEMRCVCRPCLQSSKFRSIGFVYGVVMKSKFQKIATSLERLPPNRQRRLFSRMSVACKAPCSPCRLRRDPSLQAGFSLLAVSMSPKLSCISDCLENGTGSWLEVAFCQGEQDTTPYKSY